MIPRSALLAMLERDIHVRLNNLKNLEEILENPEYCDISECQEVVDGTFIRLRKEIRKTLDNYIKIKELEEDLSDFDKEFIEYVEEQISDTMTKILPVEKEKITMQETDTIPRDALITMTKRDIRIGLNLLKRAERVTTDTDYCDIPGYQGVMDGVSFRLSKDIKRSLDKYVKLLEQDGDLDEEDKEFIEYVEEQIKDFSQNKETLKDVFPPVSEEDKVSNDSIPNS